MKILVVYFSRTGFTRTVAEQIAQASGADLEPIKELRSRRGVGGYLRSLVQSAMHRDVSIRPTVHKPADYDLVVIGTPIWGFNVASPVRAYAKKYRNQFKRVALFCTYGGSGQAKVLEDLEQLCGKPVTLTLAVTTAQVQRGQYDEPLAEFVASLQESARPRRRSTTDAAPKAKAKATAH
jgi:flavodoxin